MYIFEVDILGLTIAPSWYGLMYALGFIISYFFIKKYFIFKKSDDIDNLLTYVFFGIILGGRLGYIVLYNPFFFIENPSYIVKIWEGGMSFHGGLIGTILAVYIFCKRNQYEFWKLIDTLAIIVPIAIGLGRIGNWINNELPGFYPYSGILPMKINGINHFPSPLLEMLLEGIFLFGIMLFFKRKYSAGLGILSGIFLVGYSIFRIISEQFRLPDVHIGYLFGTEYITIGILYTVPMIAAGILLIKNKNYNSTKSLPGSK